MSKIREDVAQIIVGLLAEKVAPAIKEYVTENIAKYLPDIDELERGIITSDRILAKTLVDDWRNYKSIQIALDEMMLREMNPERRTMLKFLWEKAIEKADELLNKATLTKARVETLEQFGLRMHENKLLPILYTAIPLILLLILPKQ